MSKRVPQQVPWWLAAAATAVFAWNASASPAHAEEWLVVPVSFGEDAPTTRALAEEAAESLAQRGISVMPNTAAAKLFEERVSTPARAVGEADIDAWAKLSRSALGHLARNEYEAALVELEKAQGVSRTAVEALNRDPTTAAVLSNTCLYAVRALISVGKRATAQVQALECARLSPGVKPNAKMHPPAIRTFYEDVVEAGRSRFGTLVVESDATCEVRVNGVGFGAPPVRVEQLPEGDYRAQVECDDTPGRVHHVRSGRGTTTLHIDAKLDRAIRTNDALELSYAATPDAVELERDSRSLARLLSVDRVLLVIPSRDGRSELLAVGVDEGADEHRAARIDTTVSDALSALFGETPVTTKPGRTPRGKFIAGVSLASIGTASLVTAYSLYALNATNAADDMVALPNNENQARWLNLRTGMYYTGSAGAAALVAAMPLALPYREKTPWWAWLSGGVGVGLVATSIALAVTAPATPSESRVANPQGYVDRAKRTDPAFLAGVTAAPLLTMPLVYLLRRDEERQRAQWMPQVAASRRAAFLGVEGRY